MTYDMAEGDADRCPADLPVVPIQVSLRDVIVTAFRAGMETTSASFEAKMISMQGSAGTISSSQRPILGALIHFSPNRSWNRFYPLGMGGRIEQHWISRIENLCIVARQTFSERDRRYHIETDGNWVRSFGTGSNVVVKANGGYIPASQLKDLRKGDEPQQSSGSDVRRRPYALK